MFEFVNIKNPRQSRTKKTPVIIVSAIAVFFLFYFNQSGALSQEVIKKNDAVTYVRPSKTMDVTAAVPRNWPPHYLTDDNGNPDGFAIEVMEEVAKLANVTVSYQSYPSFTKTMTALEEKQVDIVPNVGIADFRKKYALFTKPVETFLVSAFVRSGTMTENELKKDWREVLKGKKTAVVVVNVAQRILTKTPDVPIIEYENIHEAMVDLIAGRVDALAYPEAVVHRIARSIGLSDKIQIAGTPLREIKRGIATRNDKSELHKRLSLAVEQFVNSKKYEEIYKRWFGVEESFWTTKRLIAYVGIPVTVLFVILVLWRYYSVTRINRKLLKSRASIVKLNAELEGRVEERTRDLAKQKNLFESVFHGAPDAMFVADTNRKIIMANPANAKIFGYKEDEMLGKTTSFLYENVDEYERQGTLRYNLTPKELSEPYSLTYAHKDGKLFTGETVGAAVRDENGNLLGFLGIIRDVTERELIQEQLIQSSKMATLGEMATGMAHELNQPLNVIRLAISNIRRKDSKGAADMNYLSGKLDKVDSQVDRASAIIDHMRIFGRKSNSEMSLLDPISMVNNSLGMLSEQLRLSEISVTKEFDDTESKILGSQVQVEQVILNLLSNARDALNENGGDEKNISLRVKTNGNDNNVLIEIEDNGGGIATDILPRIFEPFYTTKEVGKGTGLGLSISYGIITDMGGAITAQNTGGGITFTISFPASEADAVAV